MQIPDHTDRGVRSRRVRIGRYRDQLLQKS
jgi:hypothetical protein